LAIPEKFIDRGKELGEFDPVSKRFENAFKAGDASAVHQGQNTFGRIP
jgi:hypothetical protein